MHRRSVVCVSSFGLDLESACFIYVLGFNKKGDLIYDFALILSWSCEFVCAQREKLHRIQM